MLKEIASRHCEQYQTTARFFIDTSQDGKRHLVVKYDNGRVEFRTLIPEDRSDQEVTDLLLNDPNTHKDYPIWEHGARLYGSVRLRWPTSPPLAPDGETTH